MITVVARNVVQKDKVKEFMSFTKELIEGSRAEEGCVSYALYEDIAEPNILTFIEEWVDQEAIDYHRNTEHYRTIVPKLGALLSEEKMVNLYKVIE